MQLILNVSISLVRSFLSALASSFLHHLLALDLRLQPLERLLHVGVVVPPWHCFGPGRSQAAGRWSAWPGSARPASRYWPTRRRVERVERHLRSRIVDGLIHDVRPCRASFAGASTATGVRDGDERDADLLAVADVHSSRMANLCLW